MKKKKYNICGKKYRERLFNKGIVAINYYNWKNYFIDNDLPIPTFDINENVPSHGVVYKKFTDNKYLSLDNYDNFLFQEQCRALCTLVSYLGASSISVRIGLKESSNRNIESNISIMEEAKLNIKSEKGKEDINNLLGVKEFDETVDSIIYYDCKKFDRCAAAGGLFGVDKEIYKRLRFVNIVSERFNGQSKSFFTIYKKINTREIFEIGAFIEKLKIGANFNYSNIKEKEEIYTFVIHYHNLGKIRELNREKIKKKKKSCKFRKIVKKVTKNMKKTTLQSNKITDISSNNTKELSDDESLSNIFDTDSEYEDENEIEFQKILQKYKKTKNKILGLNFVKSFINKYADSKGIGCKFIKWKNKQQLASFDMRCQWFKSLYDIDYFFRQIGLIS